MTGVTPLASDVFHDIGKRSDEMVAQIRYQTAIMLLTKKHLHTQQWRNEVHAEHRKVKSRSSLLAPLQPLT